MPSRDFLKVSVKVESAKLQQGLKQLSNGEMAGAIAEGLTRLAGGARLQVVDRMKEVFDNPSRFTLNGFYTKPAKADDLTAWVATRDYAPNGTPAIRYLGPQIYGGPRDMTKFEKAMRGITEGQYIIPADGAPKTATGDLQRGFVTQILSRLGLMRDSTANMSPSTRKRLARQGKIAKGQKSEFYVARERGNGRPIGLYRVAGSGKVEPVLWFVAKQPIYEIRLPVEQIVEDTVARRYDRIMTSALRKALRKRLQ